MKNLNTFRFVAVVTVLIVLLSTSSAFAADVSRGNVDVVNCGYKSRIAYLKSNEYYSAYRPLIVFFPGSGEALDIQSTLDWIRSYHLYDDIDCDLLAVSGPSLTPREWEGVCEAIYDFIIPTYSKLTDDDKYPIIIDAVSFGGYGGTYLAELLMSRGIWVTEVNYADACGAGSPKVSDERLASLAEAGVHVNVWGCNSSGKISENTRYIINVLTGKDNFHGEKIPTSHGKVLHDAIYKYGLHSEWSM